MQPRLVDR